MSKNWLPQKFGYFEVEKIHENHVEVVICFSSWLKITQDCKQYLHKYPSQWKGIISSLPTSSCLMSFSQGLTFS